MRLRISLVIAGTTLSLAIAACGGTEPSPATPATVAATIAPATATVSDFVELTPGRAVRSNDGAISVRSTGGGALQVALKRLASPPAAPAGWTILDPAYDITARDRDRPVTKLESEIELSFRAPAGQAVVMYHDGARWLIVESERAADGSLVAKTDHLTPYAVAQPNAGSTPKQASGYAPPSVTASASRTVEVPTARPSLTITRPSEVPSPAGTIGAPGSVTPGATLTALAQGTPIASPTLLGGSTSEAKSALETAISKFKGRPAIVTGASSYSTTLPGNVVTTLYYGLYGGVNEAITSGPTSSPVQGAYTFLSEPKTTMPTSTTDAQTQLAAIFPGATGLKYKPVQETANAWVYLYNGGVTVSTIGFSLINGVPVAFMAYGTGSYVSQAELASHPQ